MAGSFENLQTYTREVQRIAILHRSERVFRLRARPKMDGGAAAVAEFQVAGDEVGMEMSKEYVADLKAEGCRVGQVLLNVALGIDDDRGGTGVIAEQVGGMGQAPQVVLLQNHGTS